MAYSFTNEFGMPCMMPMAGTLLSSDLFSIYFTLSTDMLNHRTGFNNARLFIEEVDHESPMKRRKVDSGSASENKRGEIDSHTFQMRTISFVQKGRELYNTYGDLGLVRFSLHLSISVLLHTSS